jgi:hypothetical protein
MTEYSQQQIDAERKTVRRQADVSWPESDDVNEYYPLWEQVKQATDQAVTENAFDPATVRVEYSDYYGTIVLYGDVAETDEQVVKRLTKRDKARAKAAEKAAAIKANPKLIETDPDYVKLKHTQKVAEELAAKLKRKGYNLGN